MIDFLVIFPDYSQYYEVNEIHTFRSPEILAPARMPVAAGKKMANTEKNPSPLLKSGPKFSANIDAANIGENEIQDLIPKLLNEGGE